MATPANPTVTTEANVKCPNCAEVIAAEAKKCKHCGEFLDSNLRQAKLPNPIPLEQPWNPGVAAVLSLVIPGAGQIYKGQLKPGIWWLVGVVVGYMAFIVPGLMLQIYCIYNAYTADPVYPKGSKKK